MFSDIVKPNYQFETGAIFCMTYSPKHATLLQGFIHCFVTDEGFYLSSSTPLEQGKDDVTHLIIYVADYELCLIT